MKISVDGINKTISRNKEVIRKLNKFAARAPIKAARIVKKHVQRVITTQAIYNTSSNRPGPYRRRTGSGIESDKNLRVWSNSKKSAILDVNPLDGKDTPDKYANALEYGHASKSGYVSGKHYFKQGIINAAKDFRKMSSDFTD